MIIKDKKFGLTIADASSFGSLLGPLTSLDERQKNLERIILSVSGFRKIFAADGDEESDTLSVHQRDMEFLLAVSGAFIDAAKTLNRKTELTLALGLDSRPTGRRMADVIAADLIDRGVQIRYLFITPAPEIMAYTRTSPDIDGFIYLSASHNPIGHNGIKLGLGDGKVLKNEYVRPLIENVREAYQNCAYLKNRIKKVNAVAAGERRAVYEKVNDYKTAAETHYYDAVIEIISGTSDPKQQARFMAGFRASLSAHHIGILAEMNGAARSASIDERLLKDLGVRCHCINAVPGQIVHRIVPEGAGLDMAADALAKSPPACLFAYVPDCDGDRGNIIVHKADGSCATIAAQLLFSLCVISELAFSKFIEKKDKLAVVVNGPTSLRVERIAERFSATVFYAEVGEANVNELADDAARDHHIRISGEGSNGGNITRPSTVRDPLLTILSLLKLLYLKSDDDLTLGAHFLQCLGESIDGGIDLSRLIQAMPHFSTTDAFETCARAPVRANNRDLKSAYEKVLAREWPRKKKEWRQKYGIAAYTIINYEGKKTLHGAGNRTGQETGGFKIQFTDTAGKAVGFLWMRASGTEPVFRVMADIMGGPADEKTLLCWHQSLVAMADTLAHREDAAVSAAT